MKFYALPLSIAVALALSACNGDQSNTSANDAATQKAAQEAEALATNGPAVTGKVSIDTLTNLPPGLSLVVKLVDYTDPAAVPVVVAESTRPAPRSLPLNLVQAYDPAAIKKDRRYGLQVAVQAETLVLYGTDRPIPVLTGGAPEKNLTVELVRGGQPSVDVPPAELAKEEFARLVENIGALRRIQGERLEADVAVGWDAFVEDSGQIRMAREQVDFADAGTAQFRYAYKGGKPWVVERTKGGTKTMVSWNEQGDVILDEQTNGEGDIDDLYARAQSLYAQAETQR